MFFYDFVLLIRKYGSIFLDAFFSTFSFTWFITMLNSIGARYYSSLWSPNTHQPQVVILNWGWDYGTSVNWWAFVGVGLVRQVLLCPAVSSHLRMSPPIYLVIACLLYLILCFSLNKIPFRQNRLTYVNHFNMLTNMRFLTLIKSRIS